MSYIYTPPLKKSEILPENWPESGGGGGGGGTNNYNELSNKPQINSVELAGSKTSSQLGLVDLKGIQAYATMPSNPASGTTVMYTGEQGAYLTGAVYRYTSGAWNMIMSPAEAQSISQSDIENLF